MYTSTGKQHYTIRPRVKCVATPDNFWPVGPFGVETEIMSIEIFAWGADFSRHWIVAARPGSIAIQSVTIRGALLFPGGDVGARHGVPLQMFPVGIVGGTPRRALQSLNWRRALFRGGRRGMLRPDFCP